MKFIVLLVGAILSGILGRMGGAAHFNTKYRDLGIPTLFTIYMLYFHHSLNSLLPYFLTFGLMFGALTIGYFDFLTKDKSDNYWLSGFVVGLSTIPCMFFGIHWYIILAKCLVIALIWGSINKLLKNAVIVEFLRYALTFAVLGV